MKRTIRNAVLCIVAFTAILGMGITGAGIIDTGIIGTVSAGELGFEETFALSQDRAAALKDLIPGTREYYYFHCLHYQNTMRLDEVDRLLPQWIKRYRRTGRVIEIENRQALLRYETDPDRSLDYLKRTLRLRFDHQKHVPGGESSHPTALDQKLIDRDRLAGLALERHRNTVRGFENRALEWASGLKMSAAARRHLLSRLARPDVPGLPRLIIADLESKHSRGFGSHPIHKRLLVSQLEELVKIKPALLQETKFVQAYLPKIAPGPDVNWRQSRVEREAYLSRLWKFASRLSDSHNSLKANILYHRLVHDRALGVYDEARFLSYLRLPRNVPYISEIYMKDSRRQRSMANLKADHRAATQMPAIGNDEPLVRSYLQHFLASRDNYEAFVRFVSDTYLRRVFAETKILAGSGDMERWFSMLSAGEYQSLRDRVDLEFDPTCRNLFGVGEQVSIDLHVKNVKKLIVKVFEISELNYYLSTQRPLDTAIDLDGLVANQETIYNYGEPASRRVRRHFEFPLLEGRGSYVIEFIGNGRSSRALVRRGQLRHVVRSTIAGQLFEIFDESNRPLKDASIWMGGRQYHAAADGTIVVPYSTRPGRRAIVLSHGSNASLEHFQHQAEVYELHAALHVDRESLIPRQKADLIVRPSLTLNGIPVTLSLLEDVQIELVTLSRAGVSARKEFKNLVLSESEELTRRFTVPDRLARLSIRFRASVENLSQSERVDLSVSREIELNGIHSTPKTEDLFFGKLEARHVLDLLGKTGETRGMRPVRVTIKHRDFTDPVVVQFQSDGEGRIDLGELRDIEWVSATSSGATHRWTLRDGHHSLPRSIHGATGEVLSVPYMGSAQRVERSELSLLETRGRVFTRDRLDAISLKDGFLKIRGLSAGDYDLLFKGSGQQVRVRITDGKKVGGYLLSSYRRLELRNSSPLQIVSVRREGDALNIRLANASKFTRVHIQANRYVSEGDLFPSFDAVPFAEPVSGTVLSPETLYIAGRDIGDEYRYILERKQTRKFPGNMLSRPSLLLHPWALRSTSTGTQFATSGESFGANSKPEGSSMARSHGGRQQGHGAGKSNYSSFDFLSTGAALLVNLEADENGFLRVPLADLNGRQMIHIIAIDPENTAYRQISLEETPPTFANLRLVSGLDPEKHFSQQSEVSVISAAGGKFVIDDILTAEFELYDSLDDIYSLFTTLSGNSDFAEFAFVLDWPKLKPDEKASKYSEYACHELNFFLYKKDPEFFRAVVQPSIASKLDKTFLDDWLTGVDLSRYLRPWAFARLNIFERILLAQRVGREKEHIHRHVRELLENIPVDATRTSQLFATALLGRVMDGSDGLGIEAARMDLKRVAATATPAAPQLAGGALTKSRRFKKSKAKGASAAAEKLAETEPAALNFDVSDEDGEDDAMEVEEVEPAFFARNVKRRDALRRLYRQIDSTKEWAENNYYHVPIEKQIAELITVNAFWSDYATHGEGPFFSVHVGEASRGFSEMMMALSVLDLPFEAKEHDSEITDSRFELEAKSPLIAFHKQIRPTEASGKSLPILVSQNFFAHGDEYRRVAGQKLRKYVSEEFVKHRVYGGHIVVTNPTAARLELNVLLQIPRGSIPVLGGEFTSSVRVPIEPYRTWTRDFYFYFPAPGEFTHYPVHVSRDGTLVAAAAPVKFHVVDQPTRIDRNSWNYISQRGSAEQVFEFLEENNLQQIDWNQIAWRMKDLEFFTPVIRRLGLGRVYDHTLWSYSIYHNRPDDIRDFLSHAGSFIKSCGDSIDTKLLTIDPIERHSYQQLEYRPLVNARAHQLGQARKILNERLHRQYARLMAILKYSAKPSDDQMMRVTYYLLLQDRIEQALASFDGIRPANLETKVQYDYLASYFGLYTEKLRSSRTIASKYAEYPVDRWRQLFAAVTAQLDEIEADAPANVVDEDDLGQKQTKLAQSEPVFDFEVESSNVVMQYNNMDTVRVNYYLMDIELLFSRSPFVQEHSGRFAFIRPNMSVDVELATDQDAIKFRIPEKLQNANVLVELIGDGKRKTSAYFANSLNLQMIENYAQLKVTHRESGKALSRVYVKVYANMRDGQVRFYKDGYTDLRGRFDYGSLSTPSMDAVQSFSLLVLSDEHGAVVREAKPPQA